VRKPVAPPPNYDIDDSLVALLSYLPAIFMALWLLRNPSIMCWSLVEHFKFFSERIGEKCPLFLTLFTLKMEVKNLKNFQHFLTCFKFSTLKMKKW
jgi:hypothetical protein